LIAVLAINTVSLMWLNRPEGLPHSETKSMFDEIRTMPLGDKLEYLKEQTEYLEYFNLLENLELTRELVANGIGMTVTYDDIVLIETQIEELKEQFGGRFDLDREISGSAATAQIALIQQVIEELSANNYKEFLDEIDNKAKLNKTLNIYGNENSFENRNIEKTQSDFNGMRDISIRYDVNFGLDTLFDSPSTDILLIILILVICIALITDEKDKRLFVLLKATPGGFGRTIAAKMGAMALCVFAVSLTVFLSNAAYAELTFGLGDVTRPIQSIPSLMVSTMRIDLLQFSCLFFAVKTFGLIIAGLIVMLVALHSRHGIVALLIVSVFSILNFLLGTIPVTSSWNWLRFLNFAALIRPYEVIRRYFNLNLLSRPAGLIPAFLIFAAVSFAAAVLAVYFSYTKKRGLENQTAIFNKRWFDFSFKNPVSWRWYEFRKIAFTNRAMLILIVFAVIQIFAFSRADAPALGYENNYIKSFLTANQGEITEESENFILTQKSTLDQARAEYDTLMERFRNGEIDRNEHQELSRQYDKALANENVINFLYERYEYVKSTPNAEFVYDSGYADLFGLTDSDAGLVSGMKLMAVLILCLCGVFPIEYKTGMYKVLNAAKFGHSETICVKLLFSCLFSALIYICCYLPDLLYIRKYYGFSGINLPLASIPPTEIGALPTVLSGIPIWGYLVLILIMKLLICIGLALIILGISLIIRHNLYSALCAFGILLTPLMFHIFGITILDSVSLYKLATVNGLFTVYPVWQVIIQCGVFLAAALISVSFISRRFGRSDTIALS
jgi:hypothetical protein